MTIVIISGGPGKPIGACVQSVALAMGGVLLGCGFFVILALLSAAPVSQGLVLALIAYCKLFALLPPPPGADARVTVMFIVKTLGQMVSILASINLCGIQRCKCAYSSLPWSGSEHILAGLHVDPPRQYV